LVFIWFPFGITIQIPAGWRVWRSPNFSRIVESSSTAHKIKIAQLDIPFGFPFGIPFGFDLVLIRFRFGIPFGNPFGNPFGIPFGFDVHC
jgi:hypothetical protein